MAVYIANWPEVHYKGVQYKPGDIIPGLDDSTARPLLKLKAVVIQSKSVPVAVPVTPVIVDTPAVKETENTVDTADTENTEDTTSESFTCDPVEVADVIVPRPRGRPRK